MAKQALYFSDFAEILSRPAFSLTNIISPENFSSLIGEYHFQDKVKCQILREGRSCQKEHNHGWLGINIYGEEGLIGSVCAREKFGAHEGFRSETSRITEAILRQQRVEELRHYISRKEALMQEVESLKQTAIQLRKMTTGIDKVMPPHVKAYINTAQRTGNWEIAVDIRNPTRGSKMFEGWKKDSLGNLSPLPQTESVFSLLNQINKLEPMYDEILSVNPEEISTPRLKTMLDSLKVINEHKDKCDKYCMQTGKFIDMINLEKLIYICNDYKEEGSTAKAIMELEGKLRPTQNDITKRIARIKSQTSKHFNGLDVRTNQITDPFQKNNVFTV